MGYWTMAEERATTSGYGRIFRKTDDFTDFRTILPIKRSLTVIILQSERVAASRSAQDEMMTDRRIMEGDGRYGRQRMTE